MTTETNLTVTQGIVNGSMAYALTSRNAENGEVIQEEIVADGQVITDSRDGVNGSAVTTCEGHALVMKIAMEMEGESIGDIKMSMTKEDGVLVTRTTGFLLGSEIDEMSVCE